MAPNCNPKNPHHWIGMKKNLKTWFDWTDALVSLNPEEMRTHGYVLGATGSGKTTILQHVIAQNVLLRHAFIILDLRGDLVNIALGLCAGRVDPRKVALFDLREKKRPIGFNPLAGEGDAFFRALAVLDAISTESDSWGVQLAETLRYGLLILSETGEPITHLERIFFDASLRASLIAKSKDEQVKGFWERYGELSKTQQTNMATPVLNKVSLLTSPSSLKMTLGHPEPIDLNKHLNTPGSVTLISLAADELHSAGRMMGNLMLKCICREIFARVQIPEDERVPIQLIVDEFEHFSAKEFEEILAEGRRFKFGLLLAHQTLAQINPRVRSMILNNVGFKAVFRTGREDGATLSKDLTGDAKALNLPNLPVGECYLWRRDQELLRVMVNAPLVTNAGSLSADAKAYAEEIRGLIPEFKSEEPQPEIATETPRPDRTVTSTGSLEDWL